VAAEAHAGGLPQSAAAGGSAELTRILGWAGLGAVALSVLIMAGVCAAGPSQGVIHIPRPAVGPPWWIPVRLSSVTVSFALWGASVIGCVGVIAALAAVARGARPSVRGLLTCAFLAISVLTVLPAAGSTDIVSYAADGRMVVIGHSPYVMTPLQLREYTDPDGKPDPIGRYIPPTWQGSLSVYGPLATAEEWGAAELGGASIARVTFWLKLWNALAFGAVVLALDRMLRSDAAMRLRGHLLWSLNPLLLWEMVASGHIDGLAAAFGVLGVAALWVRTPGAAPGFLRAFAAGVLIGMSAAIKAPFAIFGVGVAWASRKSPPALIGAAAGFLLVFAPSYAAAGRPAVKALLAKGPEVTWDSMYQVIYRPLFGYTDWGTTGHPPHILLVAGISFLIVAALAFLRMPDRVPSLPAVTPALALSVTWLLVWPLQRPWYDVMAFCLLVLYPASRLDWVMLIRLLAGATAYLPGIPDVSEPHWLYDVAQANIEWLTPSIRLLAALALVWLCATGAWGWRPRPPSVPALEPLLLGWRG
jgi:hypothetical protein